MQAGDALLDLDGSFGPLAFRAPRAVHVARAMRAVAVEQPNRIADFIMELL